MGFVKLDCGILDSSLWLEDPITRLTLITMLAMADASGLVAATAPGIARRGNLPLSAVRRSLARLESPDPDDRSGVDEGRRVKRVSGGYQVTNYLAYRERDYGAAERARRYRERKRETVTRDERDVTRDVTAQTQVEAEAEAEGRKEEPPALPPADQAERAIRKSTDALRTKLYALITRMTGVDPKGRDPTELMRLVTAYKRADGTWVKGVVNASLLTHERIEKSIADAEAQLVEWGGDGARAEG